MSLKDRADDLRNIEFVRENERKKRRGSFFYIQEDPGDLSDEPTKEIYFDFSDLNFDEDAIKERMENQPKKKNTDNPYGPFHWLERVCDCGGDKLKTTHYNWCSKNKRGW